MKNTDELAKGNEHYFRCCIQRQKRHLVRPFAKDEGDFQSAFKLKSLPITIEYFKLIPNDIAVNE